MAEVENLNPDEVRQVFDVNVMAMFWLCRAAVPVMKRQGRGRIVNLASGAGLAGGALASPYHASKHAVVGLTRSLARELGPHRIAVNAVCPGVVDTPMTEAIHSRRSAETGLTVPESMSEMAGRIPLGAMATPEQVASVVAFLLSDEAGHVTGQSINVCGGLERD